MRKVHAEMPRYIRTHPYDDYGPYPAPVPRRQFLRDDYAEADLDHGSWIPPPNREHHQLQQQQQQQQRHQQYHEYPSAARTPSPTNYPQLQHRRQTLSASRGDQPDLMERSNWPQQQQSLQQQQQPQRPIRSGGRRLPATPKQPSTLNIDSLNNAASRPASTTNTAAPSMGINFPKLNASPSRNNLNSVPPSRGARLPDLPTGSAINRRRMQQMQPGRWSRSLDDAQQQQQMSFEEAVIAGRGTRQLPTVGPQQLASAGRGRGLTSAGTRRELPRPGTTIGFSGGTTGNGAYPLKQQSSHNNISDSDGDEEDWC